jgi:hypothetical protein
LAGKATKGQTVFGGEQMTIFGKHPSEYFAVAKPFLALIVAVGIGRLALSLAGVPNSVARWVSITAALLIGTIYYAITVHTSGFGSYKHLFPISVLQGLTAQAVIIPAILLAAFTGSNNIYSVPEYSISANPWIHAGAHLALGTTVGPSINWLVGCLIMFVTRKLAGKDRSAAAHA